MNAFQPKQYIHYNPERTDYSVTPEELHQLETAGSNLWKDFFLLSAPLGVSCILNAIANTPDPFKITLVLFLNYVVGIVSVLGCFVLGFAWYKTKTTQSAVFDAIKKKPKIEIIPTATDVGAIPQTAIQKAPDSGM